VGAAAASGPDDEPSTRHDTPVPDAAGEGGPTVGFLWFAAEDRHGMRSAFVFDIQINEEYGRR